jgi:hypothetical protein
MLQIPFLTDLDSRAAVKGSRDPLEVNKQANELVLSAFVVKQSVVSALPELPLDIWKRNRSTSLVGFRIDKKNRLIAECRIPTYGLTREEFQFCIRIIAVEADRFEFLLTGRDQE